MIVTVAEAKRRRDHNDTRIQQQSQDPEPSYLQKIRLGQMTYWFTKRSFLETLPVLFLILVPLSVHAGVLSSIVNVVSNGGSISYQQEPEFTNAEQVALLKAANHTDPNPAKGGGDILIEDGSLVAEAIGESGNSVNSLTSNGEISVYIVREGDTLSQIAQMFDVSANTILWANDITDPSVIRPGSELVILPITGVRHIVKTGDTIATIAKKYDGNAEEIIAYNRLASATDISVGDTVVIPSGVVAAPALSQSSSGSRTSTASGSAVATGGGSAGFTNPLPGGVRSQGIHGYNGVDLAGVAAGSPVLAAASGEVIVAKASGWNGGYGSYVVIKHKNGTQTLYAHLSSVAVGVGNTVSAGQKIGGVGNTGRSTGIHLHFEVRGAKNPF